MPANIRIRSYNVEFGDCVLLSVDDAGTTRHVLFDFGNVAGKGGANELFEPIARDIQKVTHGTLDLVVMTHEHLDHMEGFYHQRKIFDAMTIRRVWMSIPSQPGYYDTYKDCREARKLTQGLLLSCRAGFRMRGVAMPPQLEALLINNLSNTDRVKYLRGLPKNTDRVHYLYRGLSTDGCHDFRSVKFKILAPEKKMSVYYGNALQVAEGMRAFRRELAPKTRRLKPPEHVSSTEFTRLRRMLQAGDLDAVHEIDAAENNTSLVVQVEVGGKKLLFTGDAEEKSWEKMLEQKQIGPVDFLKVSHHGSWNGTPQVGENGKNVVDLLFPLKAKKTGVALVSTKSDVYGTKNKVPDQDTLTRLRKHCKKVYVTEDLEKLGKPYWDITL